MLKDMLVYLDCPNNLDKLTAILPMILEKPSHALGYHIVHEVSLPLYATEIQVTTELLDLSEKMMMDRAKKIEECWNLWGNNWAKKHGVQTSFKSKKINWVDGLISASKYVDCVVMGSRVVVDGHSEEELTSIPSQVFFKIFRPLLVIPTHKPLATYLKNTKKFDKIMISWNESKQAFRTVDHAIPILQQAADVMIVIREAKKSLLDSSSDRDESTEESAGNKLAQYLKSRGVLHARVCHLKDDGRSISQTLLEFASQQQISLIVMGAYGHSALREKLLGGTTEYILNHADVPVFLSH